MGFKLLTNYNCVPIFDHVYQSKFDEISPVAQVTSFNIGTR